MTDEEISQTVKAAESLTESWCANEYAIHKRPPFRVHSFDEPDMFWVVGTTYVSVLHGAYGDEAWAKTWANALNNTSAVRQYLQEKENHD